MIFNMLKKLKNQKLLIKQELKALITHLSKRFSTKSHQNMLKEKNNSAKVAVTLEDILKVKDVVTLLK